MMDAVLNQWATVPATIAAVAALATALLYGFGSAWYRSLLGIVFFGLFVGSVPVFALVTVRRIVATLAAGAPQTTGDGLGSMAFAVYVFAAVVWTAVFTIVVVERRRSPVVTLPINR
jgi:hypothetical protein